MMKKMFSVLLAFALILTGCGRTIENEQTEPKWPDGVILKVGDTYVDEREGIAYLNAVSMDFARYYGNDILDYRYGANGETVRDKVRQEVLHSIIRIKVTCKIADDLNIYLSSEELAEADRETEEYMKKTDSVILAQNGITKDIIRRIYSDNRLAKKVYEEVTNDIRKEYGGRVEQNRLDSVKQEHFNSLYVTWRAETEVQINGKAWDSIEVVR